MSRNAAIKVLLIAAVPATGLAYVAAQSFAPEPEQTVTLPPIPAPAAPLDLRPIDDPPVIQVEDLAVYVERKQVAPQPVEPPPRAQQPDVREVLAGKEARQAKRSYVRMWGVYASDTMLPEEQRPASALRQRYRDSDEAPDFKKIQIPRTTVADGSED